MDQVTLTIKRVNDGIARRDFGKTSNIYRQYCGLKKDLLLNFATNNQIARLLEVIQQYEKNRSPRLLNTIDETIQAMRVAENSQIIKSSNALLEEIFAKHRTPILIGRRNSALAGNPTIRYPWYRELKKTMTYKTILEHKKKKTKKS
jgi:hypothetical protein